MAARIFLTVVGITYMAFALWCALFPRQTATAVGFELRPGSGQSEYFVVYGGLQFALACIFLLPWLNAETLRFSLQSCAIIHGSLVVFRAISIGLYGRLENTTYILSGLELALFVGAILLLRRV